MGELQQHVGGRYVARSGCSSGEFADRRGAAVGDSGTGLAAVIINFLREAFRGETYPAQRQTHSRAARRYTL